MSRNIVLCADGTGNKGGHTPDSNVFKTYNAIDIKDTSRSQITYYDNGVGTSTNKFVKAISGAMGVGFQSNVRELYTFLAKNYQKGDRVYIFGFSRGAATIRAFNGFVHDCGLIVADKDYDDVKLEDEVKTLIKAHLARCYKKRKGEAFDTEIAEGKKVEGCNSERVKIDIEFVGVWDTVAALGMPKNTDKTGIFSWLIDKVFSGIDSIFNYFTHYRSYNFELTPNINRACHALSIDDARTAFWPLVWDEVKAEKFKTRVDQVWFSGMHSDVGGGYPRRDMANVPLLWMLEQAMSEGLRFNMNVLQEVKDRANVHDKIHDSRDGFGVFYRYHPRDIETLCQDSARKGILEPIQIHESVISRLYYRTAGYAPLLLPPKFKIVGASHAKNTEVNTPDDSNWLNYRMRMRDTVKLLKELYMYQLFISLFVLVSCIYAWNLDGIVIPEQRSSFWGTFADIAQYFLPNMFNNAVELWVHQQQYQLATTLILAFLWWWARYYSRLSLRTNALGQRQEVIDDITDDNLGIDPAQQVAIESASLDSYRKAIFFHLLFAVPLLLIVVYLLWYAIMGQ
ncbi:MAG: DUF2235 domain-containing protein [Gammaproteobacteria bacterium]|nr:DUF2235 domain-containing protein [Gammaproteobacteria bacterium]